ncbi:hypothetical protein IGK38_001181 [Enterococcus pernyi]
MSATSLSKLISTRKEELAKLWELRGTDFPVVERQNDLRISFIELELADLEKLNNQPQLNENQQQVLGWLKQYYRPKDSIFLGIEQISDIYEDPKSENALDSLTNKQEAE